MLIDSSARFVRAVFAALLLVSAAAHAQTQAKLPKVIILATGGTIAGSGATSTTTIGYTAATVGVERLIQAVPELTRVAHVSGEQVFQIASESMTNAHWLTLAKRINVLLAQPDVDGIVVTHGTDTIEETAYFLDLVVKSKKPVVVVGSMRPSTAISADGPINLYNAVILAGSADAVGKGVLVCLNDQILAGREVTKTNTSTLDTEFDISALTSLPQVDIVYGYANVNPIALNAFVAAGAKGIVHAGVGDGSLAAAMVPALKAARAQGTVIVRSSRVGQGIVARNGEANDDTLDFVVSDTLNPQKARILLMLALTKTSDTKEIQRMFYTY